MKLIKINAPDFDLEKTLDSGQVFHWEKAGDGFVGTIGDVAIYIEQHRNRLSLALGEGKHDGHRPSCLQRLIGAYFALDHPLQRICNSFPRDQVMTAAKDFCRGLRIIRQPKWECLATFICSSMKQVAHIRQISLALRQRFGDVRTLELPHSIESAHAGSAAPRAIIHFGRLRGRGINIEVRAGLASQTVRSTNSLVVYTFPTPERIAASSEKALRKCALGYRTKNLLATARLIASGEVDLERLASLSDAELRSALCRLPGVGAKVANCVMLFAYERLRAFPIDVWIARVLRENYFPRARKLNAARLQAFTDKYFGDHGGYAQQYLFHHARKSGRRRDVNVKNWDTTRLHAASAWQAARVPSARNDKELAVR
jgi:N-glycosylase/DNA lyase